MGSRRVEPRRASSCAASIPSTINNVIELANNIEVGKFEYLEDPDKLRHLPADEVIGIGPGGEQYMKGRSSRR